MTSFLAWTLTKLQVTKDLGYSVVPATFQYRWRRPTTIRLLGYCKSKFPKFFDSWSYLTLDKSMVKSFHQNLKDKIKMIRKPWPVGNEIKNMTDGMSQIVLNLELYEGKDVLSQKRLNGAL